VGLHAISRWYSIFYSLVAGADQIEKFRLDTKLSGGTT
jgi:hypothetical protein